MDIKNEMNEIAEKVINIKNMPDFNTNGRQYDKHGFIYDLRTQVEQLDRFFTKYVEKTPHKDPSEAIHKLKDEPKVHQIAYFNLGHGYPKELFGGHWCYVLRRFESKFLIIPSTSSDNVDKGIEEGSEIPIKVKDFFNEKITTLQVRSMRCVDFQRLYQNKRYYNVETDSKEIIEMLIKIITKDIDNLVCEA